MKGYLLFYLLIVTPMTFANDYFDTRRANTLGDFGNIGLMQMPTARMGDDGQLNFSLSHVWPYERYSLNLQILPGVESTLRYSNTLNRLYGPADFSGSQTWKDRSFDIKMRIINESNNTPEISVGFRDLAGTGAFASEYLVASRRYYDFDFTLGMGWGNMGTRGQISNPLLKISKSFANRTPPADSGQVRSRSFFRGEKSSIFAGIVYRPPISGLTLKAELDGNNYQQEPLSNNQKVKSPINLGATYSFNNAVDLSLAFERGNKAMLQLVFSENLKTGRDFPKSDPLPVTVAPINNALSTATNNKYPSASISQTIENVTKALSNNGFKVDNISVDLGETLITAYVSQNRWRNLALAAGRAARIIANNTPPNFSQFHINNLDEGVVTADFFLQRKDLVLAESGESSAEEMMLNSNKWQSAISESSTKVDNQSFINPDRYPAFDWNWSLNLRQHIGGPDNPYFYQIFLQVNGNWQIAKGLSLYGAFNANIINNFSGLKNPSNSQLPHVRSDIKEYLQQGKNSVARLQADYVVKPADDTYAKISAGLLEEMYAGFGIEMLYRPNNERWSIGANIYEVQQRDYRQRFDLLNYRVNTGHIEWTYRLPFYNINANVSAGQYLAGDRGVTLGFSRELNNGVSFGVWTTKTNVSAAEFGEGSFDKGIFISVPLDRISFQSSRNMMNFSWRPLTRDGGQKLSIGKPLKSLLDNTDSDSLNTQWPSVLK